MSTRRRGYKHEDPDESADEALLEEPLDRDQQQQVVDDLVNQAKAGQLYWNLAAGLVQLLLAAITLALLPTPRALPFPLLHLLSLPPLLASATLSLLPSVLPTLPLPPLFFPPLYLLVPPAAASFLGLVLSSGWGKRVEWLLPLAGVALGRFAAVEGEAGVAAAEGMRAKMYGYEGA